MTKAEKDQAARVHEAAEAARKSGEDRRQYEADLRRHGQAMSGVRK
ncbi:hypothetical protein ACWEQ8_44340 [Streptomyces noursei]